MTSIQKSKNPKFKLINEWKEACPVDFNSRFIDVRNDVEYEIEHFKLKVSEQEVEDVIEAYMTQDWSQNGSFILFLISEVQAGNL
jgi:predicted sulfurtransferase|tara:strand:+ start:2619 stop:2873 length:255 start_codon:yes stop_codon:yes gene_type:complete